MCAYWIDYGSVKLKLDLNRLNSRTSRIESSPAAASASAFEYATWFVVVVVLVVDYLLLFFIHK
jgi:hypothetical protein